MLNWYMIYLIAMLVCIKFHLYITERVYNLSGDVDFDLYRWVINLRDSGNGLQFAFQQLIQ